MPKVFNRRDKYSHNDAVYIGRPSKWGNPFSHQEDTLAEFKVSTRDEAVDSYEQWLLEQAHLVADAKTELRGKDLVCWCAPARCHGDILLRIANEDGSHR